MNHGLGLESFLLCPCARLCLPSPGLGAAGVCGRVLCGAAAAKRSPAPAIYANATMGEEAPHLLPADLQGVLGPGGDPRTAHVDLPALGLPFPMPPFAVLLNLGIYSCFEGLVGNQAVGKHLFTLRKRNLMT